MEHNDAQSELIDLGTASELTLGAKGDLSDFVREIPQTGIDDE